MEETQVIEQEHNQVDYTEDGEVKLEKVEEPVKPEKKEKVVRERCQFIKKGGNNAGSRENLRNQVDLLLMDIVYITDLKINSFIPFFDWYFVIIFNFIIITYCFITLIE